MKNTRPLRRLAGMTAIIAVTCGLAACTEQSETSQEQETTTVVASTTNNPAPTDDVDAPAPTKSKSDPGPTQAPQSGAPAVREEPEETTPEETTPDLEADGDDPTDNCQNRVAPPLNEAQLPVLEGGTFNYRVKDNQFDPCKQLSWITVQGDMNGPRQAVLLYHYGDPVAPVQPLLVKQVTSVQRTNHAVLTVDATAVDGTQGTISYKATTDGVIETGSSLDGQRLAGSAT